MDQPYIISVDDVKPGVRLVCDAGFMVDEDESGNPCGCLQPGQIVEVKKDEYEELYVDCLYGHHYLDAQLDDEGKNYLGFLIASKDE